MHKLMALIFAGSAMAASVQVAVPGVATPVPAEEIPAKRVAVFVQNRTRVKAIDDEIDGIRDRLTSSLAAVDGLQLVDSSQVADSFRRYKVNTDEEKKELVSGIFTGGSIPNIARMLNCDYIIAASVVGASSLRRKQGDQPSTVFTLRMTTKIMDASGANVSSVPPWTGSFPVLNESGDDPMNYYNILFDRWVGATVDRVASGALNWRKPTASASAMVAFRVTTSIDKVVTALESQTKGTKGELLAELRKVVGGATVELDGAVVGTCPGEFRVAPGLHQIKITRQWMQTYAATVNVYDGLQLDVAMEMSEAGLAKWGSAEAIRADVAKRYSEAARERGVKVNIDTSNWRDAVLGGGHGTKIKVTD